MPVVSLPGNCTSMALSHWLEYCHLTMHLCEGSWGRFSTQAPEEKQKAASTIYFLALHPLPQGGHITCTKPIRVHPWIFSMDQTGIYFSALKTGPVFSLQP